MADKPIDGLIEKLLIDNADVFGITNVNTGLANKVRGSAFLNYLIAAMKGFNNLELTEWTTSNEPLIRAGGSVEVNGNLIEIDSDTPVSGWSGIASDTRNVYIKIVLSGSFPSVTASFEYTTTVPLYSTTKVGWYDGDDRYLFSLSKTATDTYEAKSKMVNRERDFNGSFQLNSLIRMVSDSSVSLDIINKGSLFFGETKKWRFSFGAGATSTFKIQALSDSDGIGDGATVFELIRNTGTTLAPTVGEGLERIRTPPRQVDKRLFGSAVPIQDIYNFLIPHMPASGKELNVHGHIVNNAINFGVTSIAYATSGGSNIIIRGADPFNLNQTRSEVFLPSDTRTVDCFISI